MKIGHKINQYRKDRNMSQIDLANHLGVSRQAVSKWETDTSMPDVKNVKAMASLFEVSMDVFLENELKTPGMQYSAYIGWTCNFILKAMFGGIQRNVRVLAVVDNFVLVKKSKKYGALGINHIHSVIMKSETDITIDLNTIYNKKLHDIFERCHVYANPNGIFGGSMYLFAEMIESGSGVTQLRSGENAIQVPTEHISVITSR